MVYTYFGQKSLYQGKPLFHLLSRLKDSGLGRIVYRTSEVLYDHPGEVSFYRILLSQPEMDKAGLKGRVVAERVFRARRFADPVNLSPLAHKPDFRLVPIDEEDSFCRWNELKDYDKSRDAPKVAEHFTMPPLMKKVMQRRNKQNFMLPAHKIYMEDVNVEKGRVESGEMWKFLDEEHSNYKDFDLNLIPDSWTLERWNHEVGRKRYAGYWEGIGLEEQEKRNQREKELKELLSHK